MRMSHRPSPSSGLREQRRFQPRREKPRPIESLFMHNCMNNIVYLFSCDPFSLKNAIVLDVFLEKTIVELVFCTSYYFMEIFIQFVYLS